MIRYESGLQICFGQVDTDTTSSGIVNYPAPFAVDPYVFVGFMGRNFKSVLWGHSEEPPSKTNVKVFVYGNGTPAGAGWPAMFLSVGYWK